MAESRTGIPIPTHRFDAANQWEYTVRTGSYSVRTGSPDKGLPVLNATERGQTVPMFPVGHVAYTWGAVNVLQRHIPEWANVDYRWLAVAAMLPDVADKPLAMTVFRDSQTSQGLFHTLLLHLAVAAVALAVWRWGSLPYLLAFNMHLLLDQSWHHPETLFFPTMGWEFDPYRFMGTPEAMVSVYWDIFLLPQIWIAEGIGAIILAVLFFYYRLYRWPNLRHLLLTGRFSEEEPVRRRTTSSTTSVSFCPSGAPNNSQEPRKAEDVT